MNQKLLGVRRPVLPALVVLTVLAIIAPPVHTAAGAEPGARELEVVELFTSQGCSSCPPADALLSQLAEQPDVLALSFHVDYWNRLGWRDPFSSAAWSERQRAYARQQASDSVYTPQMVIDGAHGFVGSDAREAQRVLQKVRALGKPIALELAVSRRGERLEVKAMAQETSGSDESHRPADLLVLVSEASLSTKVQRGENRNRTLHHSNVVRALVRQPWSGGPAAMSLPLAAEWKGELRAVALLQERGSLRILAAARAPVPSGR